MNSLSEASLTTVEKVIHHPNADKLDLIEIYGSPVICGRDEFKVGDPCVYVPFDSICPNDDKFPNSVMGKRVKPVKIRGIFSMGLALKNKWGLVPTDNVNEKLGIKKYEWTPKNYKGMTGRPGGHIVGGAEAPPPKNLALPGKYDIQSLRQYKDQFIVDEHVYITEKLHGTNARFVFTDGVLHVGSRGRWLKKSEESGNKSNCYWWKIANQLDLEKKLKKFDNHKMDDIIIFGEIFGSNVQDLSYGAEPGQLLFAAFDIFNTKSGKFANYKVLNGICQQLEIPTVPEIYNGPWLGFDQHKHLAEQDSKIGGGISEGFVIRPKEERYSKYSRILYKLHGERFLLRS